MAPDQLEQRIRRALTGSSSSWQPAGSAASEVVDSVRRRRLRRRRYTATIGSALVVALVVGAGAFSFTSRGQDAHVFAARAPSAASSSRAASGATSKSAGRAAPSTSSNQETSSNQAAAPGPLAGCAVSVAVGSGPSRCAGVLSSGASSAFGIAGTTAHGPSYAAATPESLTVVVGQRVTVELGPSPVGAWRTPAAVRPSALSSRVRQEFALGTPTARHGVLRLVSSRRSGGTGPVSTIFEPLRPGVVVLASTLGGACAPGSSPTATTVPTRCAGVPTTWTLKLIVTSR